MATSSILNSIDKSLVDNKERELISLGYRLVTPHKTKLNPYEYWRDEQDRNINLNPCQTNYSIGWWEPDSKI